MDAMRIELSGPGWDGLDKQARVTAWRWLWESTLTPVEGCRWCGHLARHHRPDLYVRGHGWHGWEHPTDAQQWARAGAMLKRSRARLAR